jgi:membrane-associated phospholipid phosphatase
MSASAVQKTSDLARTVTDVLQPRNVLLLGMLGIGLAAAGSWTGLIWGLLGALCAGIVPAAYIERERRRGTWGDRHVVDRRQRPPIFFVILGSIGIGALVMVLGDAPVGILVAMTALWGMTVVLLAVNTVWKISVDSAVASAVTALLCAVHSPWWTAGYVLVAAVCWSRVALGHHSVAQTAAGAGLGAATAAAFMAV